MIDLPAQSADDAALSVTVRVYESAPWTIVEVEGEMDVQADSLVMKLVGGDPACMVFDLHKVTFMDASGLGLMIRVHQIALMDGGGVRLVAPSRSARRLLSLTRCDHVFRTFDSLAQAVAIPFASGPEPPA